VFFSRIIVPEKKLSIIVALNAAKKEFLDNPPQKSLKK